jgi:hypothetical protein
MDFNQLKELTKKVGGILVLDGNEPEFIILPYDQYEKMSQMADNKDSESEEETIEKLNREILALKEEIRQKESAELAESTAVEESTNDSDLFE